MLHGTKTNQRPVLGPGRHKICRDQQQVRIPMLHRECQAVSTHKIFYYNTTACATISTCSWQLWLRHQAATALLPLALQHACWTNATEDLPDHNRTEASMHVKFKTHHTFTETTAMAPVQVKMQSSSTQQQGAVAATTVDVATHSMETRHKHNRRPVGG